jgi:hypothetical protein
VVLQYHLRGPLLVNAPRNGRRTFTVGQAAGASGTVKIHNFTEHLRDVLVMPNSSVPIPYVDLLWAALPQNAGTKNAAMAAAKGRMGTDQKTCGTIEANESGTAGSESEGGPGAGLVASGAVDSEDTGHLDEEPNVDSVRSLLSDCLRASLCSGRCAHRWHWLCVVMQCTLTQFSTSHVSPTPQ